MARSRPVEKRYQVFISSTYQDLTDERAQVIQAVLDLDHLPAGMEMFPAANADQWTLIKQVIDESDYYVVVVAGRYGSVDDAGISYTEQEYDYAVETGTPILGFVHADPDKIEVGKTDKDDEKRQKLLAFRAKVETRMVKHFTSAAELGGYVTTGLIKAIKSNPRVGWVRGDKAMTVEVERELLDLREKLVKAESERESAQRALVEDTTELAQGDDEVVMPLVVTGQKQEEGRWTSYRASINIDTTWDDLFGEIGPVMIDEASERDVRNRAAQHVYGVATDEQRETFKGWRQLDATLYDDDWDMIVVQYRALGLIDKGKKKRQINDRSKYLSLTDKGDRHLTFLRAVRRDDDETNSPAAQTD